MLDVSKLLDSWKMRYGRLERQEKKRGEKRREEIMDVGDEMVVLRMKMARYG